jgi:hypothetical protein
MITVSFITGIGSATGFLVGGLFGVPILGAGIGGAASGAIAAAFMEGSTWQDVANSMLAGGLSGLTGAGIGWALEGTLISGMQAAVATGVFTGWFNLILIEAEPLFKESDIRDVPCK